MSTLYKVVNGFDAISGTAVNGPFQHNNKSLFNFFYRLSALLLLTLYITPALSSDKYQYEYFESQLGYFKELTLGQYADNNDQRIWKWVNDINILMRGEMPTVLSDDLDSLIAEVNHIISPIQLRRVTSEEQANYFIFLGTAKTYLNFESSVSPEWVETGIVYFINTNSGYEITNGSMYIDLAMFKQNIHRKYALRDLLSKSLGISFESPRYADSIFAAPPFKKITLEYSNFDKTIIKKLYSKCVKAGMDKFELDNALLNGC